MKKVLKSMLLVALCMITITAAAEDKKEKIAPVSKEVVSAQVATVNDEYKKELAEYYKISGSDASIKIAVEQSLKMVKAQMPQFKIDEATLNEVTSKLIVEMMDAMAPVYAKHISLEDLKAMNKFYNSPAGKRIGAAMPALTKDSMEFSMAIAGKLQKIIMSMVGGF